MTTTRKTSDFRIGCHLSASEGYLSMAKSAVQIGANTFQFFTRNPRGGTAKPIDPKDVTAFLDYSRLNDIGPILAHASYTMNLCAAEERIRDFAVNILIDDLYRMEFTPGNLY
ncbi:MAG TPA: endonuclease IV, partial [Rikenellaceae bacterium]|nr:endonuclease IV [Rikenellaceae bacterium]